MSGDGCSANCLEESGFNCSINSNSTSFCSFLYLLDLDTSDGSLKLNLPDRILLSTTEYLIDMPFVYGYAVINGTVVSSKHQHHYTSCTYSLFIVGQYIGGYHG